MEDFIKKTSDSLGETAKILFDPVINRLKNPIIGSFSISFLIINWKPILYIIFSEKSFDYRLDHFDLYYYGNRIEDAFYYLIMPLCISLLYSWVLPQITNKLENDKSNTILDEINRIHNQQDLKNKHSILYASQMREFQEKIAGTDDLKKLNKEIELLRIQITEKDKQLIIHNEEILALNKQITILNEPHKSSDLHHYQGLVEKLSKQMELVSFERKLNKDLLKYFDPNFSIHLEFKTNIDHQNEIENLVKFLFDKNIKVLNIEYNRIYFVNVLIDNIENIADYKEEISSRFELNLLDFIKLV